MLLEPQNLLWARTCIGELVTTVGARVARRCRDAPNIRQVGVTAEDEVGDAGVFLLAAVPEGKLRQPAEITSAGGLQVGPCDHQVGLTSAFQRLG